MRTTRSSTAADRGWGRFFPIAALLLLIAAGCEPAPIDHDAPEPELPEQTVESSGRASGMSPREFAARTEELDWSRLEADRDELWHSGLVHIGMLPPVIVETDDLAVVVLQLVEGAAALDAHTGREIWHSDIPLLQLWLDGDYRLWMLDIHGFVMEVDPFSGEVGDGSFAGWQALHRQVAWQDPPQVDARFRPLRVVYGDAATMGYAAVERSDPAEGDRDRSVADSIEGTLQLGNSPDPVLLPLDGSAIELDFHVGISGRYELFIGNFSEIPVLLSLEEESGAVLAQNQDYGAVTDGFTLRLERGRRYRLIVDAVPQTSAGTELELHMVLLREGHAPDVRPSASVGSPGD